MNHQIVKKATLVANKWPETHWGGKMTDDILIEIGACFFRGPQAIRKIFLSQKRLRRCALTWSIWTAFVYHRAIWLIGTSWEYFHHFFPEMQEEVGRRLLSRTVCQIRGHCHINKLEVWTTWHARFSHTFVMPHF